MSEAEPAAPLRVFIVAGEESGDQLGAALVASLRAQSARPLVLSGVGGERLAVGGLTSLFPLEDIAVMGMTEVIGRLPTLIDRIRQTVEAAVAARPDVVVLIDSPDFTHRVGKRIRKLAPEVPIVGYVSPSVWAWRQGRARKMATFVDRLLAILPFEPEVHARLHGPPCVYVGHPLLESIGVLRPAAGERRMLGDGPPVLLVLPGSRRSEVRRLIYDFGSAVAMVVERVGPCDVVLPAVPHLAEEIRERTRTWSVRPHIVVSEGEKHAAFRRAHAALAASGTVSLELALAGVPTVVAYRLDAVYRTLKRLNRVIRIARVSSMVLPNIIIGENAVPEFLDEEAGPANLAAAVLPLLSASPERAAQLAAFSRLDAAMRLPDGRPPSVSAAAAVLEVAEAKPRPT
jgi:lipid-A-disaccharide synthase